MDQYQTLELRLDPNGVAEPAQRVVVIASQVVGTALRALSNDDLALPVMQGEFWGYRFDGFEMTDAERRETYQNWILSKGFQDLARGVRETLEEAMLYLAMIYREPGFTTMAKVESDIAAIRANAAKLMFPKLLETVNVGLTEPMSFEAEFLSLQKVRNCLEHRGGRVGVRDVDGGGTMMLTFPRLRAFYHRGDEEVELVPGQAIDTHDPNVPFGKGMVDIYVNRVARTRTYALNELVVISAEEFYEIAMACHMLAGDIASKLPTLPLISPSTESDAVEPIIDV